MENVNTASQDSWESTITKINKSIDFIFRNRNLFSNSGDWYIYCMGAKLKSDYRELNSKAGLRVIYTYTGFKGIYRILAPLVPSYAGVILVIDNNKLKDTFLCLYDLSLCGVYFVPHRVKHRFLSRIKASVKAHGGEENVHYGIDSDANHFIYMTDTDSSESRTGFYEFVSYGEDVPNEISNYFHYQK